jgi:hypothetical protein
MSTHAGVVRSFDLGGSAMSSRRWAARCSCGEVATTGAWHEALAFLTQHLRVSTKQRARQSTSRLTPDLRYVDYQPPLVVARNGNGHSAEPPVVRQPVLRLLGALVRVVIGALRSL